MNKSTRASAAEPRRSEDIERLTDAVNHLAEEVRVVRDVLDEVRDDFGWLTRNGIPGQRTVHTQLLQMARDPLAPDANERLVFRRFSSGEPADSAIASDVLNELVSEIAEVVTGTGQEQVHLLLGALDDLRTKLVAAINSSSHEPPPEPIAVAEPQSAVSSISSTPTKQGRLF